jgi:uncharacterized protein involved in exopolysaccharide biosynthesis
MLTDLHIKKIPTESILAFIKDLLRKWWLFLIVGLLAGIAGIFYASSKKPIYRSHLSFALDDGAANGMSGFMSIASQFGIDMGSGKDIFSGDNILQIMKSRRMIEGVLLSVDTFENRPSTLIDYYFKITDKYKTPKPTDIHFPAGQPRSSFTYKQDSVLYFVYRDFAENNLTADIPDRRYSIYEVSVISQNEKFTKVFTDKIVNQTNNYYTEIRTKKAKETLQVLEQRVAKMKSNLNSSIGNKAEVQDVNINPAFSEAEVPIQKQQANIEVYGTAYGEMFKNLELARFQYLNEIPLMQIIDAANYPMEKIKTGKLKTAVIWSFVACFLLIFIFWIRRIINFDKDLNR